MKSLIFFLFVILALFETIPAHAAPATATAAGERWQTLTPALHAWAKNPHKCNRHGLDNPPTYTDYLDGDTDPATAYQDYLSDLQWWNQTNNICPANIAQPEPMQ